MSFTIFPSEQNKTVLGVLTSVALTTTASINAHDLIGAQLGVAVGKTSGSPSSFTAVAKIYDCLTSTGTFTQYVDDKGVSALVTVSAIDTSAVVDVDLRGCKPFIQLICANTFVSGTSPTAVVLPFVILKGATTPPATATLV